MHIVIFGSGAVGGYFGGRLAHAGEAVTFIARGEHLLAMHSAGLRVDSIKGDFVINPVNATDDPSEVKNVDAILLCVKTWQIPSAAEDIQRMLGEHTFVVPLENGVEAPTQVGQILGDGYVLAGLCRIASRLTAPGHIQHTAIEPSVVFGELDNRLSSRSQQLLQAFTRAGVQAEIPADIHLAVWQKFLFISAVSGVGAVTRVPMGLYRSQPETRHLLEAALQECYTIATAQGIRMPPDSVTSTLAYIDALPPGTMASMQRDVMDGRPSELEAQNGALVHMGRTLNVPTPVHEFIYRSLIPQEAQSRQPE